MILITGGAGFIGSNLVDLLLTVGHSVRVLDDLSTGSLNNLKTASSYSDRFDFIHGDICDTDIVSKAVEGVQCVIHLAAQVSVQHSLQYPVHSSQLNIQGFLNVLEAVRTHKVSRFLYASSAAVYGQPRELPLSESSVVSPISPYGLEKLINEQYAALYSSAFGVSCLGFRFFNVYGPRQDPKSAYAGVISKFIDKLNSNQPVTVYGDGSQTRDFVYVADVANVCMKAVDSPVNGVLCVGTGQSVNLLQLVAGIELAMGKKAEIIHIRPVSGDIVHSSMNPANLDSKLDAKPTVDLQSGLRNLWQSIRY